MHHKIITQHLTISIQNLYFLSVKSWAFIKKVTEGKDAPLTLKCIRFYCLWRVFELCLSFACWGRDQQRGFSALLWWKHDTHPTLISLPYNRPSMNLNMNAACEETSSHVCHLGTWHDGEEFLFSIPNSVLYLRSCNSMLRFTAVTGLVGPAGISESLMLGGLWERRNRQWVSDSVNVFRSGRV